DCRQHFSGHPLTRLSILERAWTQLIGRGHARDPFHVGRDVDFERRAGARLSPRVRGHAGHDSRQERCGASHVTGCASHCATSTPWPSTSPQIRWLRVSGSANIPTTTVSNATPIGNHRPASGLPVAATIDVAMTGVNPPNQPFPKWYGSDSEV